MKLEIFDVEHGACSLVTGDNAARMMIDCGSNATTDWWPDIELLQRGVTRLEALAITNYDEDHLRGFGDLFDNVRLDWIFRNTSVTPDVIRQLKSEDEIGPGTRRLVEALERRFDPPGVHATPLPTFAGLHWEVLRNPYPVFEDENDLSMLVFLKCHGIGVLFTGDMERRGWKYMLQHEARLKQVLSETSILIAPHHGREGGCCDEIFEFCKPYYVVISDKGYMYDTQETVPYYYARTRGGPFRSEANRHVLTTRNDGYIAFDFSPRGWAPASELRAA